MNKYTLIATCPMGFESTIKSELKTLGFTNINASDGAVEFDTDKKGTFIANMALRCADRVLLKVGQFMANDFDELYDGVINLPWEKYIPADGECPVYKITSVKSKLFAKSASQGMVKKAIVERLKKAHKVKTLPETASRYAIRVSILKDIVTLSLDTSGESLHKRGYRDSSLKAPLRETLAALLVKLTNWFPDKGPLIDPLCGSGTILIEAALMAKRIAPNKNKDFDCAKWEWMPNGILEKAKKKLIEKEREIPPNRIFGSDVRPEVVKAAIQNAKNAGVAKDIQIKKRNVLSVEKSKYDFVVENPEKYGDKGRYNNSGDMEVGYIISNPPYGDRLEEKEDARKLYEDMGAVILKEFPNWNYFFLSSERNFDQHFGKRYNKNRKLFNGGKECHYFQYTK